MCQIRAYNIYSISKNLCQETIKKYKSEINLFLKKNKNNLIEFEKKIIENNGKYCKTLDETEGFLGFLEKNELNFFIHKKIIYLTQCYILTKFSVVDENGISRGINYEKICRYSQSSKTFSKNLMHYFQKNISQISCDFIKKICLDFVFYKENIYIMNKLKIKDPDQRSILPCYQTTKILLDHALLKKTSIVLLVTESKNQKNEKAFLFLTNSNKTDFVYQDPDHFFLNSQETIVIKGVSKKFDLEKIKKTGLKNIILYNMAKHPQYSSNKKNYEQNPYCDLYFDFIKKNKNVNYLKIINEINLNYMKFKKLSEKLGCHINDDSLFFIRHIYCENINNLWENIISSYEKEKLCAIIL